MTDEQKQSRSRLLDTIEALEQIRAEELAALTDEEAFRQIRSLCVATTPWRERPDWSGLVEQQAIFHKGQDDKRT